MSHVPTGQRRLILPLIFFLSLIILQEKSEVRPFFNMTHQRSGEQPKALANSVLCFARHIDALHKLGPLAAQIVNKHVALQVKPEHYPIVGEYLLRSIREVLGPQVATDDVIDAWGAAYGMLANILIAAEGDMYNTLAAAPGGWRGDRKFTIAKKVQETPDVTSFYLSPVDKKEVLVNAPGQYLTLIATVNGESIRRNYSVSDACDGKGYRISVKKIAGGAFSEYLHSLPEGAELNVCAPTGEFTLAAESTRPVVLVSAGVGVTPMISMAKAAAAKKRGVTHIHFTKNDKTNEVKTLGNIEGVTRHVIETEGKNYHDNGDALLGAMGSAIEGDAEIYIVGPGSFMRTVAHALKKKGTNMDNVKFEFFGSNQNLF